MGGPGASVLLRNPLTEQPTPLVRKSIPTVAPARCKAVSTTTAWAVASSAN